MGLNDNGNHEKLKFGGQNITKYAMPCTFTRYEGENGIYRPSFDKIHAARKSKKTWASLGIDPSLVHALRTIGYRKPLPLDRVAITCVQEGLSAFIAGSPGKFSSTHLTYGSLVSDTVYLGYVKTTTALVATIDLVMKNLVKMPRPHEMATYGPCAPIVVMVVPSHDLAESAYADIINFLTKSEPGLNNYVKPITVHGSINRYENMNVLHSSKAANIVIGTPGRLADMIENHLISSANLRLLVFDQAFTLGGGSFLHAMHCIKDWARDPSADPSVKTWSHPTAPTSTDVVGTHRNTHVDKHPLPSDRTPQLVDPKPRAEVPCIILSQALDLSDLSEPRDAALHQHFLENFIITKSAMTILHNKNPLQDFHGTVDVHEIKRTINKRGKKLLEDFQEMSGTQNKKVLSVTFDRKKAQGYNGLMHKAGGQSEALVSGDKCRMWSGDAFSSSDLSHLITSSIGAIANKWLDLDKLIITDLPSKKMVAFEREKDARVNSYKGVFHYLVETIGRVGCLDREAQVKVYYDPKTEAYAREDLIKLLKFTKMPVPDFLQDGDLVASAPSDPDITAAASDTTTSALVGQSAVALPEVTSAPAKVTPAKVPTQLT